MDAAEYKHVVLGLIFLKYISDAFESYHEELMDQVDVGADPEDPDEYRAENIFWVPKKARWSYLQDNAKQPNIGTMIDDAMDAIERDSQTLKGVLPKIYARPALDKRRLGELVDLISTIPLGGNGSRSKDILGRVYEYFLGQFALAEGRKAGQFYTPRSVVRLLVGMLQPYHGRIFDPCSGSGGMFVQSDEFLEAHGGRKGDISIYGQESNYTTWRLAKMNLAIRRIDANFGGKHADSFHENLHRDLRADYVLANPPFNESDWGGDSLRDDARWKYGMPPASNANYAWIQHFIHHLVPNGMAGFVLANGSMSSQQSGEGEIRKSIIEDDLVDCMVALPAQLFHIFDESDFVNMSFTEIQNKLASLDERVEGGLDAVIVDHMNLFKFGAKGDPYEAINQYVSFFRKMSLGFHKGKSLSVILLAQANREGHKRAVM